MIGEMLWPLNYWDLDVKQRAWFNISAAYMAAIIVILNLNLNAMPGYYFFSWSKTVSFHNLDPNIYIGKVQVQNVIHIEGNF